MTNPEQHQGGSVMAEIPSTTPHSNHAFAAVLADIDRQLRKVFSDQEVTLHSVSEGA